MTIWDKNRPVFAAAGRYRGGLAGTDNDVTRLVNLLRSRHGYARGETVPDCAEQVAFSDAVNKYLGQLHPGDHALIYVSGHGEVVDGRLRFAFDDVADAGGYAFSRIVEALVERKIKSGLFIIDTCGAGAAGAEVAAKARRAKALPATVVPVPDGFTVIGACLADQVAHYDGAQGMSRFTHLLCEVLEKGIPNAPPILTAAHVVTAVNDRLEGQEARVWGRGDMPVAANVQLVSAGLALYRTRVAAAHEHLPSVFGGEPAALDTMHVDLDVRIEEPRLDRRTAERRSSWTLESLLAAAPAETGGGTCWQIEGVAGSGKSTLARHVARSARRRAHRRFPRSSTCACPTSSPGSRRCPTPRPTPRRSCDTPRGS